MASLKATFAAAIFAALTTIFAGAGWTQDWQMARSKEGNFSVLLPAQSSYLAQRVDSDIGELTWHNYAAATRKGDCGWLASYVEFPAWYTAVYGEKKILDLHVDQLRGVYRVRSDKEFFAGGISGREVRLSEDTDGVRFEHYMRLFVIRNRLYKLHVAAKDALPPEQDLQKFVGSFRWLPKDM